MSAIPEYPGIKPAPISTYTLDFGEVKDTLDYLPVSYSTQAAPKILPHVGGNGPITTMKNKVLKEEVRTAVNNYLTTLINERSQPGQGHGMAVSAHDLMLATKGAGHHASKEEADQILSKFRKPPVIIIKPSTSGSGAEGGRNSVSLRSKSVPVPYAGQRPHDPRLNENGKKDYHWLVWKTTPTPQVPPTSADSVPARAHAPVPPTQPPPPMTPYYRPPSSRPWTAASRDCYTPAPDDPQAFSPDPFRSPLAQSTVDKGRGFTPAPPNVPCPGHQQREPTPISMQADHHDNMTSPQMCHKASANGNELPKFVPALNAWVANATDQEKDVAYNLFKALNAGMNPLKIHKVKPKGKPRAGLASGSDPLKAPPGGPTQLYRQHPAGVLTPAPGSKAYLDKNIETQYIKLVANSMQQAEPSSYSYAGQGNTARPWPTHMSRSIAAPDYTHENSFFQNSMPQYRSHFTIHPEWISESTARSRNLKLLMCTKGEKGIRYMAQRT